MDAIIAVAFMEGTGIESAVFAIAWQEFGRAMPMHVDVAFEVMVG